MMVGTAMDMTPTILILTPVLMPVIKAAGIDPVYFGVLFIINNSIGLVTPPVGTVLNVVAGVGRMKMDEVTARRGAVHDGPVRHHVFDGGVPGPGDGAREAVRGVRRRVGGWRWDRYRTMQMMYCNPLTIILECQRTSPPPSEPGRSAARKPRPARPPLPKGPRRRQRGRRVVALRQFRGEGPARAERVRCTPARTVADPDRGAGRAGHERRSASPIR